MTGEECNMLQKKSLVCPWQTHTRAVIEATTGILGSSPVYVGTLM